MAFQCGCMVLQVEQHRILNQWLGLADTSRNGVESLRFFEVEPLCLCFGVAFEVGG